MIRQAAAGVGCLLLASLSGCGTRAAQATTASAVRSATTVPVTAYVAADHPTIVTPVRLATGKTLRPIRISLQALDVAVTPNGSTVVVVGYAAVNRSSVTLIHTATGKAFTTVKFTGFPWPAPIMFTPDSRTAYIANDVWSGTVIPVRTRTGRLGSPIRVGHNPEAMAITPDGKTAYVTSETTATVTPIRTATNTALRPIRVGSPGPYPDPEAIAITPDGKTAYVLNAGGVTPITIATGRARRQIPVDPFAGELAMTPDGKIVYAVDGLYGILYPIRTATGTALRAIRFAGPLFGGVAFTPDSRFVYVASGDLLIPVRTATGKRGQAIRLPELISTFAIAP